MTKHSFEFHLFCGSNEISSIWTAFFIKSFNALGYHSAVRLFCLVVFVTSWIQGSKLSSVDIFTIVSRVEAMRVTVFVFGYRIVEDNVILWFSVLRIQVHFPSHRCMLDCIYRK